MTEAFNANLIRQQLDNLIDDTLTLQGNIMNVLAFLKYETNLFWIGTYILHDGQLKLDLYQGSLACTKIDLEKGACGRSFTSGENILIDDVSRFDGYIACHSETQSEIVLPRRGGNVEFVLDTDSVEIAYFTPQRIKVLEHAADLIERQYNRVA